MEKIINYKLKDFLMLSDVNEILNYLVLLENLNPLTEIKNPTSKWWNRKPKRLKIKSVKDLSFGDVTLIRNLINEPELNSLIEIFKMVSELNEKQILNLGIIQFYGIFSFIKQELLEISNWEVNELIDDEDGIVDIHQEMVQAKERMARFGVLNTINSLANDDVTKWDEIQKLPYMTVFTKLKMDMVKNKIQSEIAELKRKQLKQ